MKRLVLTPCAAAVLLALTTFARSGDDKEPRAIINKALEAQGGEAKLAKFGAKRMKGTGKLFALGDPIDFSLEVTVQGDKQMRIQQMHIALDLKIMDQNLRIEAGINGNKGWGKLNDTVEDLPAEEVKEHKEQMHSDAVTRLLVLKDKDYQLSGVGEVKVGNRSAVGVHVAKKGHRDVNLFFDKQNGRLVKSEYVIKDIKTSGDTEITQTTLYSEYKEFQGTRQPARIVTERDGKKFSEMQVNEIQLLEKVDNSTFERP
jgi:hypothetical protein